MLNGLGKKLLLTLLLGLSFPPLAQASLTAKIDSILARKSQKKVQFAVKVIDLSTGRTLYRKNSDQPMIPASNAKIVTSAAALRYLGADYVFTTKAWLLDDSLVITGSGDPLLGDPVTDSKYSRKTDAFLNQIVTALKIRNIVSINGIMIDTTIFDDNLVHPSWSRAELNRRYAAEVSGLNYNANCVKITTTNTGSSVRITIDPPTSYISIVNKVKPVSKGSSAVGAYRNTQPNKLIIKGRCRKAASFDTTVQRPAAFFGNLLADKLRAEGIAVKGMLIEKYVQQDKSIKPLAQHKTLISDVIIRCNKDSFGLAAEALVKTISAQTSPSKNNGNWPHGMDLMAKYLATIAVNPEEFTLDDGSGLSTKNRLTTDAIAAVLTDMYRSNFWPLYKSSLAVGGVEGSAPLRKYFKNKKYKGKIFAKSGTVNHVAALSGVCSTEKGDYLFAVIANKTNSKTRTAINDIVKTVIDNASSAP